MVISWELQWEGIGQVQHGQGKTSKFSLVNHLKLSSNNYLKVGKEAEEIAIYINRW